MNRIARYLGDKDPFWFSLLYFFTLIAFVLANIYYIGFRQTYGGYYSFMALFLTLGPMVLTGFHIWNYRKTIRSIPRIISLYLQVVMMFGCIHFLTVAAHAAPQIGEQSARGIKLENYVITSSLEGIDASWLVKVNVRDFPKDEVFKESLESLFDCMYFSLMTSTTVGYGDISPKSFTAKLTVMIQVLVSMFIAAFGAGSFFSNNEPHHRSINRNHAVKK